MRKIYGNHLGIVINNVDPENRNRVQVFVPHITNTVYKGWVDKMKNEGQDFSFKQIDPSIINDDVLLKLKITLPWAECASPIFGGSTGSTYNPDTRRIAVNPVQSLRSNANNKTITQVDPELPTVPAFSVDDNNPSAISTGDLNPSTDFNIRSGVTRTSLFAFNNDGNTRQDTNLSSTQLPKTSTGIPNDSPVLGYTYPIQSPQYKNVPAIVTFKDGQTGKEYTVLAVGNDAGGRANNGVVGNWGEFGTNTYRELQAQGMPIDMSRNSLSLPSGTTATYQFLEGTKVTNQQEYQALLAKYPNLANAPTTSSIQSQPVQNLNRVAASGRSDETIGGDGASVGFFSTPGVGSKVWVFFHGGDVQKPVYFAAALEPEAYKSTYQPQSPSPKQQVNENTVKELSELKNKAGGLTLQYDVSKDGSSSTVDNSYVGLQNNTGTLFRLVRGDIISEAKGNASEKVEIDKWVTVKGKHTLLTGIDKTDTVCGDLKIIVGKQTDTEVKAAEEIQTRINQYQKARLSKVTSKTVGDPILNQMYLKEKEPSALLNRLISSLLPFKCFAPFLPTQIPFMRTTSGTSEVKPENNPDKGKTKVPYFLDSESYAKANTKQLSTAIDEKIKSIRGGTGGILCTSDFSIVAGLKINDAEIYKKEGKTCHRISQNVSKDGMILIGNSQQNIDKVNRLDTPIGLGNIKICSANKLTIIAGSPGIDILSSGHTEIKSGSINLVSSEGETLISSGNVTTVGGKIVHINADDRSGKGGVSITSAHTMVNGAFHVAGNVGIKGGLTTDGNLSVPFLTAPSMRSETTMSTSSKAVTQKASWLASGMAVNAYDLVLNAAVRNTKPGWILTPSAITTIIKETYNTAMLSAGVEPGIIGIAMTAFGPAPVIGFTHTHGLVSQDHSHEITLPKGNYYNDRKSWGASRADISPIPVPANGLGDGPSPGPRSIGGCGGGGFGFGNPNSNMSIRRDLRNQQYGLQKGDYDYTKIGNVTYKPDGTPNIKNDFSWKDEC